MLHGDLSNQAGVTIAFRCEDFLIEHKKSSIQSIRKMLLGEFKYNKVNKEVFSIIEKLYRDTSYTVDLVVDEKLYPKLKDIISDIPHSRTIKVSKPSQIAIKLITGDITYYVDDDDYRLSLINNRNAIKPDKLNNIVSFRKRFCL